MSIPILKRGWTGMLLVTVLCLAGAAGTGYLLYCDLFRISLDGKGKTMAVVETQNSLVKRRAAASYLWNRTQTGQNIFQRDSVLVGPESSATLKLQNGAVLEIGENSLIRLDDLQKLNQNFMRGAFVVRSETGDQKITVDKSGKIKREKVLVRLLTPASQAKVYSLPGQIGKVTFRWKPFKSEATQLSLQVSPEEAFPALRTQSFALVDTSVTEKTVPLPAGKYYWRLTGPEAPVTEARPLRVAEAEPMKPVWPTQTAPVERWQDSESGVEFRWVPSASREILEQGFHHIDIARDEQFKDIVRTDTVAALSGSYHVSNLDEGDYFWRVRSQFGEYAVAAPAQKISVKKVASLPVLLTQPEHGQGSLPPARQTFRWDFDRNDAQFVVEVERRDGDTWTNLVKQTVRRRQYVWNQPVAAEYRWRVTALSTGNAKGQAMGESEWRPLTYFDSKPLVAKAPTLDKKIEYWTVPPSVELEWEAIANAAVEYEVEYSLTAGLKLNVSKARTRESKFALDGKLLGPGKYFWRVKVLDPDQKAARLSEIQTFTLVPFPLLAAPSNALPKAGVTLSVMQMEADPSLEWEAVPEATAYEVTLRNAAGKALTEKTSKLAFPLKGFAAGKYNWSVRAIDKASRKGEELPWREFTLHFGPLPAPKSVISEVK